ncbi:MAG: hypothetical protein F6K23_22825 [Okeania sp. SIO2C9]|uniref:hypothetical protein n=1 Tax=Okeania sp. SIO2C9 TaxID=2607791 RepID=UPI0013C1974B|nr:hypothetical protein [Okeania sp. SIO2C9]NEQ75631.1 hypothetical protein [Okeania sp. SIO2C9]
MMNQNKFLLSSNLSKGFISWCLDNPTTAIAFGIYLIFQVLVFIGVMDVSNVQKFVPAFFGTILLLISTNALKSNRQIEDLKNYFDHDKVEFIDRTHIFFERLTSLLHEESTIDVLYVSKNPMTTFTHPSVQLYRDKLNKLITENSQNFMMRRLIVLNSEAKAEWICNLFEKYKQYPSYYMRTLETSFDTAFTGYLIVNQRYCFMIMPREPDSAVKTVAIDSETVSQTFLERYNELWKSATIVDDGYCEYLKNNCV